MENQGELKKLYTGGDVIINRIKNVLENEGIKSLIKDGFRQGLAAGFGDGVPSAIDIFVLEDDFDKASKIVNDIIVDKD